MTGRISILFTILLLLHSSLPAQVLPGSIDSIKQAINDTKSDTDKVNLLISLSRKIKPGDTAGKLMYAQQALSLSEKINWVKGKIAANELLGDVYGMNIKNGESAQKHFEEAIMLAKESEDKNSEVFALEDCANYYALTTQYSKSLLFFNEALNLKTGDGQEIGILGNMGSIYARVGDYSKALTCYDSSLRILDEFIRNKKESDALDTMQRGGLLITIAEIYVATAAYDRALANYNGALSIGKQVKGGDALQLLALIGIASTYHIEKKYDNAITYYSMALKESERVPDNSGEVTKTLDELANIYLETGDMVKASEYAKKALAKAEEHDFEERRPSVYITLGKISTAQKNYNSAVDYLQKAVSICNETGSLIVEKDAWQALSNTYQQMNKPELALTAFQRFIAIRDSVYNISKANELTRIDLQSGYETEQIADSLKQASANNLKMQKQELYTMSGYAALAVVLLLTFFIYRSYTHQKQANVAISRANEALKKEKFVSETLLHNILPEDVAKELKTSGSVKAKLFDHVTVLFTDFVNFTKAAEYYTPQELVAELHTCFKAFDGIVSKYNIEKIKTVGDAYLAVGGLPKPDAEHAANIIRAAIEIRDFMAARKKQMGDKTFGVRIGINSGTVVAGIVGVKKFAYDIWGDTVNIAARMEQYSDAGKINISRSTYDLVKDEFVFEDRGELDAKHKGKMRMYFVERVKSKAV